MRTMRQELLQEARECSDRGLAFTCKWLVELANSLPESSAKRPSSLVNTVDDQSTFAAEYETYLLAKSYFDCKEYQRAAEASANSRSIKLYFLHMYSWYMYCQKKKRDSQIGSTNATDKIDTRELCRLQTELKSKYGIVMKALDFRDDAVNAFVDAVNKCPLLWCAWEELIPLCSNVGIVMSLSLPEHWIKNIFLACVHNELHCTDEALTYCQSLENLGFQSSPYVKSIRAISYYNKRDYENAEQYFEELHKTYPLRLDNMDIYSNILYVQQKKGQLSDLAYHVSSVDKFSVITCYVVGNYYSAIDQHKKAVRYFQRALTLDPDYLFMWTLIGHEYMELTNTSAAIEAYRKAIAIHRNDFRAWYGLGQAYEILHMPFYSLYYYKQAQALRPNDSRMWVALGDVNVTLDKLDTAKQCYLQAASVQAVTPETCLKLARLMERTGDESGAEIYYLRYIEIVSSSAFVTLEKDVCHCHRYLANYYFKHADYDSAIHHARKCCEFAETCEEGKAILQQLSKLTPVLTPTLKPSDDWEDENYRNSQVQNQSVSMNLTDIADDLP